MVRPAEAPSGNMHQYGKVYGLNDQPQLRERPPSQHGSTHSQEVSGNLYIKQVGQSSTAGNVGRTGTAKINQDSVFVQKLAAS